MKILPIITEKSMINAKEGVYTFLVPGSLNKYQVKEMVGKIYGVDVKSVRSVNKKSLTKKDYRGRIVTKKAQKKVYITLGKDQKLDIFEEKKGK